MDAELRQLERSGDPISLLRARVRTGQLSQSMLQLAARCGHPGALELTGDPGADDWLRSLAAWGRETCVRAGIAVCKLEFICSIKRALNDPKVRNLGYPPLIDRQRAMHIEGLEAWLGDQEQVVLHTPVAGWPYAGWPYWPATKLTSCSEQWLERYLIQLDHWDRTDWHHDYSPTRRELSRAIRKELIQWSLS